MQNLTARYNYIYNSRVILNDYEAQLLDVYADNYNQVLQLYVTPEKFNAAAKEPVNPPVDSKELDLVITKAQAIIADKSYSNYIDDAYLLLGKAQFFKGNYFIATEYFDYIIKNFKKGTPNFIEALDWKARSLMQRNDLKSASVVLDTLNLELEVAKKVPAEPLATFAQMDINLHQDKEAIAYLEEAVKKAGGNKYKMRWTYILAQLYEDQKNYEQALKNYRKVQNSNASFELYFNANLNRIKINALLNGEKINRKQQLAALLKDDKNDDYTDQIYYQIAESYLDDNDYPNAEKYYQLSVSNSTKNQYQKGLSYLKIADLNFKYLRKYLKAKAYYDSTVNTLPLNYPGYDLILKKGQNLEYLTTRYETIATQDTMQMLVKLPETERNRRIELMFTPAVQPVATVNTIPVREAVNNPFLNNNTDKNTSQTSGTFYFSNTTAISKGYTDFKKKWGNRKLEDNWRQSIRKSGQTNTQNVAALNSDGLPAVSGDSASTADNLNLIKKYNEALPLTPELLSASNDKIIDAYFEIANFYQQELNETAEAIRIYQLILERYPDNKYLAAINYTLYLDYKDKDAAKANGYKEVVLSRFPGSIYASTITDPSFSLKQSALDAAAIKKYNEVFADYEKRDYQKVVASANEVLSTSADNTLSPQFAYLKAIAIGRTSYIDSLLIAFKSITTRFANDQLIVPLVKEHLSYIEAHLQEFKSRRIALMDFDGNEPRFVTKPPAALTLPKAPVTAVVAPVAPVVKTVTPVVVDKVPVVAVKEPIAAEKPVKAHSIFSTAASGTWYFVVDVADASLTLSSSRFGIGQFNRGNFPEADLRHQLTEFDDDQLIYVGNFSNFEDAKAYAYGITPRLKQIMKVPENIYKSFIISKENFDKLNSRMLIDQYIEFYKNNY
ncbi:tetratricopeptide repeat protein [Pedobacter sp. MC2016-14]|uniref:type IX secretion system periplasmic lipoprotein PorW/SprE n=1 Tax=Pedobacter sp. MC2016-14 TaxID=2897327 RepID=UPI001E5E9E6B|nr:tetratricopeptide repeat protein [Pedobacter sp. MC2016-14]MCD0487731.1 tetratricopeptide repeat protein [Pedobacter sp. MC2016-14]